MHRLVVTATVPRPRRQRPRGFTAPYAPRPANAALLQQVLAVLDEYIAQLPLTCRQVFYRLVGRYGYEKTELAYGRLLEMLNLARRGGAVPFTAIRDDGPSVSAPTLWDDADDWLRAVQHEAGQIRLSPWDDQPAYIEVICEAGGMVPMLAAVAAPFGVTVRSGGGFDSVSAKYDLAQLYSRQNRPVIVLHVGDYDASGEALWTNLQEDVGAFCSALGGELQVRRLAVTPEQQARYALPTAPPKAKDKRGVFTADFTVQAEALPPDTLQAIVRDAIRSTIDVEALESTLAEEQAVRNELRERLAEV